MSIQDDSTQAVSSKIGATKKCIFLAVHISVQFKRCGGRKLALTPDVPTPRVAPNSAVDDTMIRLLVKTHRWRRLIEAGQARSITDLAEQEKVTDAYVRRDLLLTSLRQGIVVAILNG